MRQEIVTLSIHGHRAFQQSGVLVVVVGVGRLHCRWEKMVDFEEEFHRILVEENKHDNKIVLPDYLRSKLLRVSQASVVRGRGRTTHKKAK